MTGDGVETPDLVLLQNLASRAESARQSKQEEECLLFSAGCTGLPGAEREG